MMTCTSEGTLLSSRGRRPGSSFSPFSASLAAMAWYRAVTPSSLKREAMVPNTGICCARAEGLAVALDLLAHVAQRVLRALAVELVDRHEIGEVEHVDLLELARGAELRRHHVERNVGVRHDGRIALADAGRLDDNQLEPRRLARGDSVAERSGEI